ncbi:MAG: hypothetical protein AMXMBFR79_08350 [Chitinophagaceae bacterium]
MESELTINMHNKPRILITISFSFSIRYIIRTGLLDEVRKFAQPVIVLTWNQEDLIDELKQAGYEVHIAPETKKGNLYVDIRKKIDYWFVHFKLKSATRKYQNKYLSQYNSLKHNIITKARKWYNITKLYLPGTIAKIFAQEKKLLTTDTNYNAIEKWVNQLNVDTVFTVTPFHAQEDLLLRACKNLGKKMITSILSFDNITKRGWIPVEYDIYMVWNKYNFNELIRIYPSINKEKIFIVGAPQFDFYFDSQNLLSKEEWMKLVGIKDSTKKIILYAGGPKSLFPNEPQYLKKISQAIDTGSIDSNSIILFRCHPVDVMQRWKDVVGESNNVVFDSSWTGVQNLLHTNITLLDIKKLCSTLFYTDVHINLCSTMSIDGSAFAKPQIAPAFDYRGVKESKLLKAMYYQEHFAPIMNINGVSIANSQQEMIDWINKGLSNDTSMIEKCKQVLEEIITYTDGNCTNRVVEVLKNSVVN